MPKMKSISGAKKRFRVTGSGKIRRARPNLSHNLNHKPSKRTRTLRKSALVCASDIAQVERMLLQ